MHLTLTIFFDLVILAYIALSCLLGFGYPGYTARGTGGHGYILWFIVGIVAIVVGVLLVLQG